MNTPPSTRPVVEQTEALSPHAAAILKAGEQLLLESVQTGREFCKALVGVSFSAVPIYVGLLGVVLPKDTLPTEVFGMIWVLPVALFLLGVSISALGHLPQRRLLSIDLPSEVETAVSDAVARRYWCGVLSFSFLIIGIVVSIWVIASAGG